MRFTNNSRIVQQQTTDEQHNSNDIMKITSPQLQHPTLIPALLHHYSGRPLTVAPGGSPSQTHTIFYHIITLTRPSLSRRPLINVIVAHLKLAPHTRNHNAIGVLKKGQEEEEEEEEEEEKTRTRTRARENTTSLLSSSTTAITNHRKLLLGEVLGLAALCNQLAHLHRRLHYWADMRAGIMAGSKSSSSTAAKLRQKHNHHHHYRQHHHHQQRWQHSKHSMSKRASPRS
jgi:hypothetical protein